MRVSGVCVCVSGACVCVCTHHCKSFRIKASAKQHILLLLCHCYIILLCQECVCRECVCKLRAE